MAHSLLVVDDEEFIIASLRRLFRREDITVLSAKCGEEALELLQSNEVAVIISDQLMPNMTGVEFLSKAREIQSDTIRIVLSGYSDIKSIIDAINQGAIWRFIPKPWDDDVLLKIVSDAFRQFDLVQENKNLTKRLASVNTELKDNNVELKKIVENKSHSLSVNMQILQISQNILEQLPIGVLAVDSSGMIVIANDKANQYLKSNQASIVGMQLANVLATDIYTQLVENQNAKLKWNSEEGNNYKLTWTALKQLPAANGNILTLMPTDD